MEGKHWECLGIKVENREERNVLHIYAEDDAGITKSVGENFFLLIQAGIKHGRVTLQRVLREINPSVPICICKIPEYAPFITKWTKAFRVVNDVHNKILGYYDFCNKEERKAVEEIYGISRWYLQHDSEECLLLSLSKYFNAISYSKDRRRNRVYIIGACIISGYCVSRDKTLAYKLQKQIVQDNYEVVRIVLDKQYWFLLDKIKELPIRQGDIVMLVSDTDSFEGVTIPSFVRELDLSTCYNNMGTDRPYFSDRPIHVNEDGHALLSEYIYKEYLKPEIQKQRGTYRGYIQEGEILSLDSRKSIEKYVNLYRFSGGR